VGSAEVWRALRRALHQTADNWGGAGLADSAAEDVTGPLNALYNAIREAAGNEEPSLRDFPSTIAGHRLLETLRRGFLAELATMSERIDGAAIVAALGAFETVQQVLDQDCTQRFTGRLAEPDGPALVVEVAHDMRSPLASILFLVETLRNGQSGPVNSVQDRQLGLVYSAAFGLSSLASDVIELARGGERLLDAEPSAFSVVEIFNTVRDIVLPMAEEKGLSVRLAPPGSDWRIGCPAALHRVLLNLTTNALKFTSEGSVEVRGKQISRNAVEFSVSDTGRGIPPKVMDSLCDAFRPGRKRGAHIFSSAGLGLSICRKLVTSMGGELRADSAAGVGTRFHFTIDLPPAARV
jgi:K+-sensing histidine kinase KdpD